MTESRLSVSVRIDLLALFWVLSNTNDTLCSILSFTSISAAVMKISRVKHKNKGENVGLVGLAA